MVAKTPTVTKKRVKIIISQDAIGQLLSLDLLLLLLDRFVCVLTSIAEIVPGD
jgi:hypothetical protein